MSITDSKVVEWVDTETYETRYGVKVKSDDKWKNLAIDGKPFFVGTWKEARNMCRELLGLPDKT